MPLYILIYNVIIIKGVFITGLYATDERNWVQTGHINLTQLSKKQFCTVSLLMFDSILVIRKVVCNTNTSFVVLSACEPSILCLQVSCCYLIVSRYRRVTFMNPSHHISFWSAFFEGSKNVQSFSFQAF